MTEIPHIPEGDFEKSPEEMTEPERIAAALNLASSYGQIDRDHHKLWVIDRMVRVLSGCPVVKSAVHIDVHGDRYTYDNLGESEAYQSFIASHNDGEDGPDTFKWDAGIAP
jgi:hypothetical protein